MKISMIVAVAENGVIGADNQLIWHLSDDLKNFKKITSGHFIIMGRKTYESIGKPLPNRTNIILSRNASFGPEDCLVFATVEQALEFAKSQAQEEIFIIGGEQVYRSLFDRADKLYLTRVFANPEGDAFFPTLHYDKWKIVSKTNYKKGDRNDFDFEILELERK